MNALSRPRPSALGALAILLVSFFLLTPTASGATVHGHPVAAGRSYPTAVQHVVVVFLENQEASTVLAKAPYERSIAQQYAYAANFYSVEHYSLPNYLAATSGAASNYFHPETIPNVGTLATSAGLGWAAYMESMPKSCATSSSGLYTIDHDPFVMYKNVLAPASYCDAHVLSFTALSSAVASGNLPSYSFVAPNQVHDGHTGGLATADAWLKGWLPSLLGKPFMAHTVIFVLYDEGLTSDHSGKNGHPGGGHVYFTAVGPLVRHGYASQHQYNTFDLLTTTEWLLGLGSTGHNDDRATNPPMSDLFGG